jgi:HD-GYP domain-containing protein (c-di-GMP phosphodiesterase class II)
MDPSLVATMVKLIEAKDLSTAAHTWRVVLYARAMGEVAGLEHSVIERLTRAAALHDIGKLDIPDAILQKPGPLTDDERAVMQTHTTLGHERLLALDDSDAIDLELVRYHHERLDGTGYPDRLLGPSIPRSAKYFAVIDTFDAMTSYRPYRDAVGPKAAELALRELNDKRDAWYCAEAVQMFEGLYRSGRLAWVLEYFNDSCPVPPLDRVAHAPDGWHT